MPSRDDPRPLKLASSFQSLSTRAIEINTATKQLSSTVTILDEALRRLNLGITSWVPFQGDTSDDGGSAWAHELGHAKVNGKWGLAIRYHAWSDLDPLGEIQEWCFADASRELRILAIDYVPKLLDQLNKEAEAFTEKLKRKVEEAEMLAKVLNAINRDAAPLSSQNAR